MYVCMYVPFPKDHDVSETYDVTDLLSNPYRSLKLGRFKHDLGIPWVDGPNSGPYGVEFHIKGQNKVPFGSAFQTLVL